MPYNGPAPDGPKPPASPAFPPFRPRDVLASDDNPELDGTDAAHPAWWRGQEYGFDAAMRMIEQAMVERPVGVISNERWQALRERVYAMASRSHD